MFLTHYNIATEGIRAGHKILSKLGFGFSVEVIITPKPVDTGGGAAGRSIPDLREYLITVKIRRKDKVWSASLDANHFQMKSFERIIVTFKSINAYVENISFKINNGLVKTKEILVKIFTKN